MVKRIETEGIIAIEQWQQDLLKKFQTGITDQNFLTPREIEIVDALLMNAPPPNWGAERIQYCKQGYHTLDQIMKKKRPSGQYYLKDSSGDDNVRHNMPKFLKKLEKKNIIEVFKPVYTDKRMRVRGTGQKGKLYRLRRDWETLEFVSELFWERWEYSELHTDTKFRIVDSETDAEHYIFQNPPDIPPPLYDEIDYFKLFPVDEEIRMLEYKINRNRAKQKRLEREEVELLERLELRQKQKTRGEKQE